MRLTKIGKLALAMALCIVLGLATTASAVTVGVLHLGSDVINIDGTAVTGGFNIALQSFSSANYTGFISGNISLHPDINYSFALTNLTGADLAVDLILGPVVPSSTLGGTNVRSSLTAGLTDGGVEGQQNGDASLTANLTAKLQTNTADSHSWAVGDLPFGFVTGINGFSDSFDVNQTFADFPGLITSFQTELSFKLSAYDNSAFTGDCQYTFVPLPPSLLMLGSGLLGMGLVGWRRRAC